MRYGEGFKGATYDFACERGDADTLCEMLKRKKTSLIELISFDKTLSIEKRTEVLAFAKNVRGAKSCIAKIFKGYGIGLDRSAFFEELDAMKRVHSIFGRDTERETTLTSLKLFGFNFVAARIAFEDESEVYVTFSHKCDSTLASTRMTRSRVDALISDACKTLVVMQRNDFAHCDLKPDNIIFCRKTKRFKIIDWGMAKKMSARAFSVGTLGYGCPLAHYFGGKPAFVARRLMRVQAWWKDREWHDSDVFASLRRLARDDFDSIVASGETDARAFERYKRKFDVFSLGLCVARCLHGSGIDYESYRGWIENAVSMRGFVDAASALRSAKTHLRPSRVRSPWASKS